jgi:hypothetical protein
MTASDEYERLPSPFPRAPWRADKTPGGYAISDATGQAVSWVYSRPTYAEAMQAKVLTPDEASRDRNQHRAVARAAKTRRGLIPCPPSTIRIIGAYAPRDC